MGVWGAAGLSSEGILRGICGVAPSEGDDDESDDHEGDEEAGDHYENGRVTGLGGIEEGVGLPAGDGASDHGIDEINGWRNEPGQGGVPGKGFASAEKDQPEEYIEYGDGVVEEDVGQFLQALRVPDVAEQEGVCRGDDGHVGDCDSLKTRRRTLCAERSAGADDGDEQIAEDGEETEVVEEDARKNSSLRQPVCTREMELQAKGKPGKKSQ